MRVKRIEPWLRRKNPRPKRPVRDNLNEPMGLNELTNDRRIERAWEEMKADMRFLRRKCKTKLELKKSTKKMKESIDKIYRLAKKEII